VCFALLVVCRGPAATMASLEGTAVAQGGQDAVISGERAGQTHQDGTDASAADVGDGRRTGPL